MAEDIHKARTAKQAQDPVCKMIIDVEKAAARIDHGAKSASASSRRIRRSTIDVSSRA